MNRQNFFKTGLFVSIVVSPVVVNASSETVVTGITPGRLAAILAAVLGLISIIIGGLALRASARILFKKRGAVLALIGALVCIILSIVHLARATGGFGTGSGKLGAIVALVFGGIGMTLGGIALARYKKMPKNLHD